MNDGENIFDVTDAGFEKAVLDESRRRPVVVDFWAAWCAPCRMLAPVIEKAASAYDGRTALARLNVDENPAKAAEYGIRGVPTVKLFYEGRAVDEFIGLRDENFIRRFIEAHLPPAK